MSLAGADRSSNYDVLSATVDGPVIDTPCAYKLAAVPLCSSAIGFENGPRGVVNGVAGLYVLLTVTLLLI